MPYPDPVARAIERWGISPGEPYPDVYPGNVVYRCTLRDGTAAVLKFEPPRLVEDEFGTEVAALELYGGRAMPRLLAVDRLARLALIELVTPGEPLWHVPIEPALEAIAAVMGRLRDVPPDPSPFPDVRLYHRAWPNHIRLYGGAGPIDSDLFELGEQLFLELCDTSSSRVVLHGDLHFGNVLTSHRSNWLAIDPKGITGDPCYEVGDVFRNRVDELFSFSDPLEAMRMRVELVARLTGFDGERVRLWALAQAVLSEIWSADHPETGVHIDLRAARLLRDLGSST